MILAIDGINAGRQSLPGWDEEVVQFADEGLTEDGRVDGALASTPWRVLIADDDEEVHLSTAFVLRDVRIDARPLELFHAHSAVEAEALLRSTPGIAVVMLDVVMETPDAGLRLVEVIRKEICLRNLRIILRTGQPGYAPELDVIRDYDINDYRTKVDLSQTRLITSLTSALRAYHQLEQIQAANRGMHALARASNALLRLRHMQDLARSLFEQLGHVIGIHASGFLCVERTEFAGRDDAGLQVLHGCGEFAGLEGKPVKKVLNADIQRSIQRCVAARTLVFEPDRALFWLGSPKSDAVVVLMLEEPLSPLEQRLLDMFSATLSVGFGNVDLIERLDFFAYVDPLTRLPNRTRFLSEVSEALFARRGQGFVLALVDVVRFSDVNEALGLKSGDSLLALIAKRLRSAFGSKVSVARISGDTFGLFGPADELDPQTILGSLSQIFFVHGHALSVRARIGMVSVAAGADSLELLRNASMALAQAKELGMSCAQFSTELLDDARFRVGLLHSLRAAIDFQRGLSLSFQPVFETPSCVLKGLEVLVRWRDDSGSEVAPSRFIPIAEQTGLIGDLARWVMDSALKQFARWKNSWARDVYLSFNVSAVQFRDEGMSEWMLAMLREHGVEPTSIVIELNEAVCREECSRVRVQLARLRSAGVRLAFDNFGSEGLSLRQLQDFPLDLLKVERSFVERAATSEASLAMFKAILDLSRARGLGVVAKCVETPAQRLALEGVGCQFMQGFLFAEPLPEKTLEAWVLAKLPGSAA